MSHSASLRGPAWASSCAGTALLVLCCIACPPACAEGDTGDVLDGGFDSLRDANQPARGADSNGGPQGQSHAEETLELNLDDVGKARIKFIGLSLRRFSASGGASPHIALRGDSVEVELGYRLTIFDLGNAGRDTRLKLRFDLKFYFVAAGRPPHLLGTANVELSTSPLFDKGARRESFNEDRAEHIRFTADLAGLGDDEGQIQVAVAQRGNESPPRSPNECSLQVREYPVQEVLVFSPKRSAVVDTAPSEEMLELLIPFAREFPLQGPVVWTVSIREANQPEGDGTTYTSRALEPGDGFGTHDSCYHIPLAELTPPPPTEAGSYVFRVLTLEHEGRSAEAHLTRTAPEATHGTGTPTASASLRGTKVLFRMADEGGRFTEGDLLTDAPAGVPVFIVLEYEVAAPEAGAEMIEPDEDSSATLYGDAWIRVEDMKPLGDSPPWTAGTHRAWFARWGRMATDEGDGSSDDTTAPIALDAGKYELTLVFRHEKQLLGRNTLRFKSVPQRLALSSVSVKQKDGEDAKAQVAYAGGKLRIRSERRVSTRAIDSPLDRPVRLYHTREDPGSSRGQNHWVETVKEAVGDRLDLDNEMGVVHWRVGGCLGPFSTRWALEDAAWSLEKQPEANVGWTDPDQPSELDLKTYAGASVAIFDIDGLGSLPVGQEGSLSLAVSGNALACVKGLGHGATAALGFQGGPGPLGSASVRLERRGEFGHTTATTDAAIAYGFFPKDEELRKPRTLQYSLDAKTKDLAISIALRHCGATSGGDCTVTLRYALQPPATVPLDGVGLDPEAISSLPDVPSYVVEGHEEVSTPPQGAATRPPYVDASDVSEGAVAEDDPLAVLRTAQPWKDPRVQELIDEWLHISAPKLGLPPEDKRVFHWNEWGTPICPPSVQSTGRPPGDRFEFLFTNAARFESLRHYTLREYIARRLQGLDGTHAEGESHDPLALGAAPPAPPGKPPIPAPPANPPTAAPPADPPTPAPPANPPNPAPPAPKGPRVGTEVGDRAPEIQDPSGHGVLPRGNGHVVLVAIGTDVGDLSRIRPMLGWFRSRQQEMPFQVAGVCTDAAALDRYLKGAKPKDLLGSCVVHSVPQGLEKDYRLAEEPITKGEPRLFVLDADGIIRFRGDDPLDKLLADPTFRQALQKLLPGVKAWGFLDPPKNTEK